MSIPPFWGDVGVKKWSPFLFSATRSTIFWYPKLGTFGKSAHFQVPENGTSSARIQKLRPLFHANIPPKWWSRCLFYSFTTFGRVIGKFWILNILSSFLQCEKTSSIFCPHIVQWENTVSKRDIPVVPIDSTNAFTAFTAFCISVEHC